MGRCRNSVLLMVLSWLPLQGAARAQAALMHETCAGTNAKPDSALAELRTSVPCLAISCHAMPCHGHGTLAGKTWWHPQCPALPCHAIATLTRCPLPPLPHPHRLEAAMPSSTPMMVASCSWAR